MEIKRLKQDRRKFCRSCQLCNRDDHKPPKHINIVEFCQSHYSLIYPRDLVLCDYHFKKIAKSMSKHIMKF